MKIVGCGLHARQQTIAMVDMETGEFTEKALAHEGKAVREFYSALEGGVVVGIEAPGAMQWFLELLEELGIEYRAGHPAKIRAQETRKQKPVIRAFEHMKSKSSNNLTLADVLRDVEKVTEISG